LKTVEGLIDKIFAFTGKLKTATEKLNCTIRSKLCFVHSTTLYISNV